MQPLSSSYTSFTAGAQFELDGLHHEILYSDSEGVLLLDENGKRKDMPLLTLQGLVGNGLKFVIAKKEVPVLPVLTDIQHKQLNRKMTYVEYAIAEAPQAPTSKQYSSIAREKARTKLSDPNPPGLSTINEWIRKYIAALKSEYALLPEGGHGRNSKFSSDVTDLADEVIVNYILVPEPFSTVEAYEIFKVKVLKEGLTEGKIPAASTFANWISELQYFEVINAQDGFIAKDMASRQMLKKFSCPHLLGRVEFDAIHIQIGLLDDGTRKYRGSIIIMVAIDVFSRCILGYSYHVGKGGESVELTTQCVQNAVMPKAREDWSMCGLMSLAACDAGASFVSTHFTGFLAQFNINRLTTAVKKPYRKPFVENFFKTLRKQLLTKLKGYLGSARYKGVYKEKSDLKKEAFYTVSEFRELFENYICENYHQSGHEGLRNRSPASVWNDAVGKMPGLVTFPEDIELFKAWGGRLDSRKLHPTRGITANKHCFNSRTLGKWYSELYGNPSYINKPIELMVSHSKQDISKVLVFHPKSSDWITLPNTNPTVYSGMSELEFTMQEELKYEGIEEATRKVFDVNEQIIHHEASAQNKAENDEKSKVKGNQKQEKTGVTLGEGNLKSALSNLSQQQRPQESFEGSEAENEEDNVDAQVIAEQKPRKIVEVKIHGEY
ncbi:DDE-type integrase/transposase/recombinase [Colwellia sp. MB3u-4]|uniref:DDE-type integrase/transposase/recombinase n=1 Tax=Colwellia sp. MB3u-4 TaxID=2759822 RepID=UPI0015F5AD97|nr:DDE-type integrase/transposase/recombinase [Colwellia sp. MB3u-4]MBA6288573.1 transposase family protein [Colwellia sp. MB3u-4]